MGVCHFTEGVFVDPPWLGTREPRLGPWVSTNVTAAVTLGSHRLRPEMSDSTRLGP